MDQFLVVLQVISVLASLVQTAFVVAQAQGNKAAGGPAPVDGLPGQVLISRKRLYWLLGSVIVTVLLCGWSLAFPRSEFSLIAPEKLIPVTGRTFVDETVVVDGKDFEDCTFLHVTLRFEGKHNFTLSHNHLIMPMRLTWSTEAAKQASSSVIVMLQEAGLLEAGKVGMIGDGDMVLVNPPSAAPTQVPPSASR